MKLYKKQVALVVTDLKSAYDGTNRKEVEVFEWDRLGFSGQLWEIARQLSGDAVYETEQAGRLLYAGKSSLSTEIQRVNTPYDAGTSRREDTRCLAPVSLHLLRA